MLLHGVLKILKFMLLHGNTAKFLVFLYVSDMWLPYFCACFLRCVISLFYIGRQYTKHVKNKLIYFVWKLSSHWDIHRLVIQKIWIIRKLIATASVNVVYKFWLLAVWIKSRKWDLSAGEAFDVIINRHDVILSVNALAYSKYSLQFSVRRFLLPLN